MTIDTGLAETKENIPLSAAADNASPKGTLVETPTSRLRARTLRPLIWFYIGSNILIAAGVFVFALLERRHPSFGAHIITSGVVEALIYGNTAQVAAMIIAAFNGLFDSKPGSTKGNNPS